MMDPSNPQTPNPSQPTAALQDLKTVVTDVLGDLAFMVMDDAPAEFPTGTVWIQAEIGYEGATRGTLRCWCTREFAIQLAANLLGIEADDGEALVSAEDAACEFMNVLCGQLVTIWYGTEDVYNLKIPKAHECLEAPQAIDAQADAACQLSIDGEPLFCTHHREA
jgi:hypothetical protein